MEKYTLRIINDKQQMEKIFNTFYGQIHDEYSFFKKKQQQECAKSDFHKNIVYSPEKCLYKSPIGLISGE
jgi:hypothetical protein